MTHKSDYDAILFKTNKLQMKIKRHVFEQKSTLKTTTKIKCQKASRRMSRSRLTIRPFYPGQFQFFHCSGIININSSTMMNCAATNTSDGNQTDVDFFLENTFVLGKMF